MPLFEVDALPIPKGWNTRELLVRKLSRLEDVEVKRWYENVARGSLTTADSYLRALFLFSEKMKVAPRELWKLKEEELYSLILDYVTQEEKRGLSGRTIHNNTKAVRSWLLHKGIQIVRPIKIRRAQETTTLENERVPTQEELRRIFFAGTPRDRVSSVLVAHSGVRLEVIGNYLGNDGLRLKDFPELRIRGGTVEFERIPSMVVVRPELSKAGHRYFTFLGAEGCEYVAAYLNDRAAKGEKLTPETDLIHGRNKATPFVRTMNVSDGIKVGIVHAVGRNVKMRPYVLRAYFDTQPLLAESKGKVAHDYRVFWMGHKGSMEARYTTNKGRLPQALVSDMREAYSRCELFLSTAPGTSEGQVDAAVNRQFLRIAGFTDEEIADLDLSDVEKVRALARERLTAPMETAIEEVPIPQPAPSAAPYQIVVHPAAVASLIANGWRRVDRLSSSQVVMESPSNQGTSPTPSPSRPVPPGASGPARPGGPRGGGGVAGGAQPLASGPRGQSARRVAPLRNPLRAGVQGQMVGRPQDAPVGPGPD